MVIYIFFHDSSVIDKSDYINFRFMLKKRILLASALLLTAVSITSFRVSAADYVQTQNKAERYFAHKEWASASAMYQLMLYEQPEVAETYARAIVAEGMMKNESAQMQYFNTALKNHIPLEKMLKDVRRVSFGCGSTDLYEQFLLVIQSTHPWMSRVMDKYLLDYYSYRCNGPEIVSYSQKMLAGLPDDISYLKYLARGYLLQGDLTNAMSTYRHIIEVDPDNTDALLYLGNYYRQNTDERDKGLEYLRRAYALQPTPYVAKLIREE